MLPPVPKKRRWPRVVAITGLVLVGLLATTYLIPVNTSGTQAYREAAPPGTEFVAINGVDIAVAHHPYTGEGKANTLYVLLHGFGASSFSWRDIVGPLSARGDVIAYDRTGFGFSERPESWQGENPYGSPAQCQVVDALADRYRGGHEHIVVVGHSAGGTLALDCAIYDQSPATHLVLIAPAALSGEGPPGIGIVRFLPPVSRLGPLLVRGISESGNGLLFDSVVDKTILTPDVLAGYQAPLTVMGWEAGLWEFTLSPRRSVTLDLLGNLDLPTLVITGDSDSIVSPVDSRAISQAIPGASFVEFDGVGHLPQEEVPDSTLTQMERFLAVTAP